jgi:toxin ParE1/3/4
MRNEVLLTAGAEHDLESIVEYVAATDGDVAADHVLQQVLDAAERLAELPERGAHPQELLALGIREYRQVFFKPYRVIYRVIGQQVFIVLIADGRRDMQTLLARRLLAGP